MKQGDIYESKNYNYKIEIKSVDSEYVKYIRTNSTVTVKLKKIYFDDLFKKECLIRK